MTTLKLRLFGAAATLALVSACSGSNESDRTTAPDTEVAQSAAPSAPKAGLPGKLGMLQQALGKVSLRPEQKTEIDKLIGEAAVRHENLAKARTALKNAVAAQLEANNYDRAALSTEVLALENAIKQTTPADRAGLMRLHAILDSAQRNQLVDAFKELRHAKKGMKGEGRGRGGHGFMKAREWARDLALTEEQIDTIKGAMRDKFQAGHDAKRGEGFRRFKGGKQLFESFRSDQFTLDETTFPADRHMKGASKVLDVLDVAVPTLTPEQRKLAAQKLRAADL
jgi:Spy/CpxP family protein refolding chaperone